MTKDRYVRICRNCGLVLAIDNEALNSGINDSLLPATEYKKPGWDIVLARCTPCWETAIKQRERLGEEAFFNAKKATNV